MVGVGPLDSTATLEIGSYSSAEALGFVAFEVLFLSLCQKKQQSDV